MKLKVPRKILSSEEIKRLSPSDRDYYIQNVILEILRLNERGVTILLVEQKVYFSLEITHRAYVLESGRIVLEGQGRELIDNEHVKKAYLAM